MKTKHQSVDIIERFNKREKIAFSHVYLEIFNPLSFFAQRLFQNTEIDPKDIVQDIFVNIWGSTHKFQNIDHVKSYLYQSIRNKHKNYLKHSTIHDNFSINSSNLEEYQSSQMIETEVYSILNLAQTILSPSCAEILKLYVEGYDVKDISEKLGKSEFTIYNQKRSSITLLKTHLKKGQFIILLKIISI